MIGYQGNVLVNLVIAGLIISGGLGFIVWVDLRTSWHKYKENFKVFQLKRYISALSVHTKIVLIMTTFLIVSGMMIILALEFDNPATLGPLDWPQKVLASFFQSTTLRTAGFATVDMASLHVSTKLLMSMFMFIGGSPAGTAGGRAGRRRRRGGRPGAAGEPRHLASAGRRAPRRGGRRAGHAAALR